MSAMLFRISQTTKKLIRTVAAVIVSIQRKLKSGTPLVVNANLFHNKSKLIKKEDGIKRNTFYTDMMLS